jgi:hypothetical protein
MRNPPNSPANKKGGLEFGCGWSKNHGPWKNSSLEASSNIRGENELQMFSPTTHLYLAIISRYDSPFKRQCLHRDVTLTKSFFVMGVIVHKFLPDLRFEKVLACLRGKCRMN